MFPVRENLQRTKGWFSDWPCRKIFCKYYATYTVCRVWATVKPAGWGELFNLINTESKWTCMNMKASALTFLHIKIEYWNDSLLCLCSSLPRTLLACLSFFTRFSCCDSFFSPCSLCLFLSPALPAGTILTQSTLFLSHRQRCLYLLSLFPFHCHGVK